MAELLPNVRLNLANTPENVVLVREMLSGVAQAINLDGSDLNDVRTAVTEACNNVVLHAYLGERGALEVEVRLAGESLNVLVRDRGVGVQEPGADTDQDGGDGTASGIGLHVIRTLCRHVEFKDSAGGGTTVWMEFAMPSASALGRRSEGAGPDLSTFELAQTPTTTTLSIAPIGLARTVLPRVVSALAARAHFSTDRISDAQLLADALVAHAHDAVSGDHLSVSVQVEPRDLELRIAPLSVGRAQRLIGDSHLEGLGRVIEKLTDRRDVATVGPYETLTLGLIDRRD